MNAPKSAAANAASKAQVAITNTAKKLTNTVSSMNTNATSTQSPFFWILLTAVVGLFIYCILTIQNNWAARSTPNNVAVTTQDRKAIFDVKFAPQLKDKKSLRQAIQEQGVTDRENCLINFQPLTVIHPGFLGPLKDGVYDERVGATTAIRMGARCFVLPIDFHDKETMAAPFPPANTPCLLYRDEGGTVRSINGGSIASIAQVIADVAWSDIVSQRNDPFLLILYFLRTPQPNTREYLDFLSKVAIDLGPLSPYLLGQTPEGVYNRQARQNELLFVNTSQLEKKLLVFSNADTTGFRTSQKDFKHSYVPKEDLDFWVHVRIFKQNLESSFGITGLPEKSTVPRSMVERIDYYTSLPTDAASKKTAVDGTKEKCIITLGKQGENPNVATITKLLDEFGVQILPLFLIDATPEATAALGKWTYAWRAKPKSIRYVRPEPIVIQAQNPIVNANGGMLRTPGT
jgi:hypothetical protein